MDFLKYLSIINYQPGCQRCQVSVHVEKYGNKLLITSCIDNLLKGAVGQAVQNMNIMFNLDETAGLRLKASAF